MSDIHPVAIGGNIFGYSTDYNETKDILSMCSDYGLNLIDTADVYSKNLSEKGNNSLSSLMEISEPSIFEENKILFNGKEIFRKVIINNGIISISDFSKDVQIKPYNNWGEQKNGAKFEFSEGYKRLI